MASDRTEVFRELDHVVMQCFFKKLAVLSLMEKKEILAIFPTGFGKIPYFRRLYFL